VKVPRSSQLNPSLGLVTFRDNQLKSQPACLLWRCDKYIYASTMEC
jgi:hypothetical protein